MKRLLVVLSLTAMLTMLGCSNPADNKTEAVVSEPSSSQSEAPAESASSGMVYTIAADSTIGFTGAKMTGSHDGGFKEFSGSITIPEGDMNAASVNFEIVMASLWADSEDLKGHLASDDFFGVETHPTSTFVSTGVVTSESGEMTLSGDFTLHGVTKNISFPFTAEVSDTLVTAKAEFFINRFDFAIEYPGMQDNLIKDEVVIHLELMAAAGMDAPAEEEAAEPEAEEATADTTQTQPA